MVTVSVPNTKSEYIIPPATRLGHVHLTVANLDRQISFYQKVLGMQLHWRRGTSAGLGAGEADLLRLTEVPGARRSRGTTGLYHFALMYPNRKQLARATARLFALRYPNAPTDHFVSESIYLDDPEGQTIELYIPTYYRGSLEEVNGEWVFYGLDGKVAASGRDPLDVDDLFKELTPDDQLDLPLPRGTSLGHVNLWTTSVAAEMHFYRDVIGFQKGPVSNRFHAGEVGVSEAYKHVVAFNTWQGEDARPAPANSLGIRYFTVELPGQAELERALKRVQQAGLATEQAGEGTLVKDPAYIGVVLGTATHSQPS